MIRFVTCVAAAMLGGAAHAQTIFSDDFSSGTDAAWIRADLIGGTTYNAASQSYQINSVPLPALPQFAGAGAIIGASAANPSAFANGSFRTTVRMNNAVTNVGILLRTDGTAGQGYLFGINNVQNLIGISVRPDATFSQAGIQFDIDHDVDYFFEASAFGTTMSLKFWATTDPEPMNPLVVLNDATWTGGGFAAMIVYNHTNTAGALSATFDDVTFTIPAPGSAALLTMLGAVAIRRRR